MDDDQDWSLIIADYLKDQRYETTLASNASEAMDLADQSTFDLFIIDINLAGESGPSLMQVLQRNFPGAPILLYTGQEIDEASVKKFRDLGAAEYLRKGPLSDLLDAVRRLVPPAATPGPGRR